LRPKSTSTTTTLLLEDPSSGELYAAAPYTSPLSVEQALDSTRFFAITVVEAGKKAVVGMGFEERSEAFDFSIALQDARRVMGMEKNPNANLAGNRSKSSKSQAEEPKRDFSLKEGETISINLGGLKGRRSRPEGASSSARHESEQDALFSIKPPPGSAGGGAFLPPPPSAKSVKEERRRSRQTFEQTPQDLGFDDGEFGEFQ
jgi:adaptin ear-binding coat-associated protein 1/2